MNLLFMWFAIFFAVFCLVTGHALYATIGAMCACAFYSLADVEDEEMEVE